MNQNDETKTIKQIDHIVRDIGEIKQLMGQAVDTLRLILQNAQGKPYRT